MESGNKFFQSAVQLNQRWLPSTAGSGVWPTSHPAGSEVTGRSQEKPRLQALSASATRLRQPQGHCSKGPMAFTSLWGTPCHYYFQSKLSTCRTPLCHAIFHKMIPIRHSEGTSLVSETAPNGMASLWHRGLLPGLVGLQTQGYLLRRPRAPQGPGQSHCHRAEAGSPVQGRLRVFAKESKASVWVWSLKLACHTCHHSALFKCRETTGNQTHLYYIHISERGIKIINCLEIDKWCETVK